MGALQHQWRQVSACSEVLGAGRGGGGRETADQGVRSFPCQLPRTRRRHWGGRREAGGTARRGSCSPGAQAATPPTPPFWSVGDACDRPPALPALLLRACAPTLCCLPLLARVQGGGQAQCCEYGALLFAAKCTLRCSLWHFAAPRPCSSPVPTCLLARRSTSSRTATTTLAGSRRFISITGELTTASRYDYA